MLVKVLVAGVVSIVDAETMGQAKAFGLKKLADSVVVDKNVGAADLVGVAAEDIIVLRKMTEEEKAEAKRVAEQEKADKKAEADRLKQEKADAANSQPA